MQMLEIMCIDDTINSTRLSETRDDVESVLIMIPERSLYLIAAMGHFSHLFTPPYPWRAQILRDRVI